MIVLYVGGLVDVRRVISMKDIIIDTKRLHIRHIEPVVELPYNCPKCKSEIEPNILYGMVSIVLGDILMKEIPEFPSQNEKVRIIIQREGEIV